MTTAISKKKSAKKTAPSKKKAATNGKVPKDVEHDLVAEATQISLQLRNKRHEQEGLKFSLKECNAEIDTLADRLASLFLDISAGQGRLPLKNEATQPEGNVEADVDGWHLIVTKDGDDFVAVKSKDDVAEQVGVFTSLGGAQKELLDAIGWHGDAPEWAPIPLSKGAAAAASGDVE